MRKKPALLLVLVFLTMVVFGCSGSVDENKPLSEVKAEAQSMSAKQLQAMIDKYKAAIDEKMGEVKVAKDKLKEIPLTQMLGEDAKLLKTEIGEIKDSLKALQDRMKLYLKELEKQATAK